MDRSKSQLRFLAQPPTKMRVLLSLLEILGKLEGDKTYSGADSHSAAELETASYHCIMALSLLPTSQRRQPKRN